MEKLESTIISRSDVHHKTIGILEWVKLVRPLRNGQQVLIWNILYHNRTRKPEAEENWARFIVLC